MARRRRRRRRRSAPPLQNLPAHTARLPPTATSRSGTGGWRRSRKCCTPRLWCTTTCWTSVTRGEVRVPAAAAAACVWVHGCLPSQPASQPVSHPASQGLEGAAAAMAGWPSGGKLGGGPAAPNLPPSAALPARARASGAAPCPPSPATVLHAATPSILAPPCPASPIPPPAGKETVNSLYGTRVAVLAGDFLFAQSSWFLANLDNMEVGGGGGGGCGGSACSLVCAGPSGMLAVVVGRVGSATSGRPPACPTSHRRRPWPPPWPPPARSSS